MKKSEIASLFRLNENQLTRIRGFSLSEILVVLSIIALVSAFAVPSLVKIVPERKVAIGELAAFLELARARAMATRQDVFICFADSRFPVGSYRWQAIGMFMAADLEQEARPLDSRELRRVDKWLLMPDGILLAEGRDLPLQGNDFETILDSDWIRSFNFTIGSSESHTADLPYLVFNKSGRVEIPKGEAPVIAIIDGSHVNGSERNAFGRADTERGEILMLNSKNGNIVAKINVNL